MTSVETNNTMAISSDYIRTSLQALYGNRVNTSDIRGWCDMNGVSYQTVTSKIKSNFVMDNNQIPK